MTDAGAAGNGPAPRPGGGPPPGSQQPTGRRSPWPLAIVIGLILVAIVNLVFIVIAVRGGEPVVESYSTGQR